MPAKILVSNLPSGTTAEEVELLFREDGAEVQVVSITGDGDNRLATVQLDLEQRIAQQMVARGNGTIYKGRKLSFYAPILMK